MIKRTGTQFGVNNPMEMRNKRHRIFRSRCARRIISAAVLSAALLTTGTVGKAIAQDRPMFSISPRFYQTFIDSSDFSETIVMPVVGLTLSIAPFDNWDFSLNGLYGEGSADFTALSENPSAGFGGPGEVEAERTDIEFLVRYRFPESPAYVMAGARYIRFEEEFMLSQNTAFFNAGIAERGVTDFYFGEIGGGFATRISKSGRHSAFANLVFGFGTAEVESDEFEIGNFSHTSESSSAILIDGNVGYQYAIQRWVSLSFRYRLISVNTGLEGAEASLVHGPEIAATFRF